jgi:uncharacterized protein (DUF885 family)
MAASSTLNQTAFTMKEPTTLRNRIHFPLARSFSHLLLAAVAAVAGLAAAPAVPAQNPQLAPTGQGRQAAFGPGTPLEERRKALNAVFHDYWEDYLKHNPEFASSIGDLRYNDQISDYSVRAVHEGLSRELNFLLLLGSIDSTGFTDDEKISQELLIRQFEEDQESEGFKEWELSVNQMQGVYNDFPELVAQLSFKTVKDYDDWIARLHAIPIAFEQVTQNLTLGMQDGRVPPKFLLEKTLEQVKELANQKAEESPLAAPLKKFPKSVGADEQARIKHQTLEAISKEVLPAYLRFARFMEVSYVPAGREQPGIGALADGKKYYQFLIKRTTTTNLTPDEIHQIGLDEVKKDEAAMEAIAEKLGFKDLASFRASVNSNPKMHPASADALMDAYRGYIKPMQAKLPELFGRLPKAPLEVAAVPAYMEKTAPPAYYEAGTPDGSRPGRLFVDRYNATQRNLYSVESIAYHEDIPEFRKYNGYTSFVEGWALYAEQLGKDVGFYQDPYSDYGRLENDVWRAIRLVVDTGVHSEGWTRQQMVDYFHAHSNLDEPTVQSEVDRYIAWPSQALAYKIGQRKILELRERAKTALGAKFDIRGFHDQVIDAGAVPLDVLEQRINRWIAAQGGTIQGGGKAGAM